VEAWEAAQCTRVFLRNALSSSLALDTNFVDNTSGMKTETGANEEGAKHHQDEGAISYLVKRSFATIQEISYLHNADYICAVPAMASKGFDLPSRLAQDLSSLTGKQNLTPSFRLSNKTKSLKECSLEEKWDAWSEAVIEYDGPSLSGTSIILVDDKYQSGITQQYFGMFFQKHEPAEVHGLCMVKTLRDTDNTQVIDD
jgi:predicted amidophosphoribosyltransferase